MKNGKEEDSRMEIHKETYVCLKMISTQKSIISAIKYLQSKRRFIGDALMVYVDINGYIELQRIKKGKISY
jgi:hypothetical protein